MHKSKELNCPTCKKNVFWNEDYPNRPFCSHRCQLIDLGEWANESYSIPASKDEHEKDEWA